MTSPAPRFDSIDYTRPEDFLFLHPSFVGSGSIADLASRFAVANQEATLGNIWCWLSHFKCVNDTNDYGWRPAIEIIGRRRYIGCADHALVYGCVARACGIPTVWVKSLETAWIRRYRETKVFNGGSGHVFLEMFLAGRWRLVDATQDELFDEYDPNQHLLPGPANHPCERYAYDKGADPRALVLSLDWEPWVSETKHYLDSFDCRSLTRLPAR